MQNYSARAIMWMTYLHYLPSEQQQLKQHHNLYNSYIEEFIKDELYIFELLDNMDSDQNYLGFQALKTQTYSKHEQLYEQIEKDIPRTLPKVQFLKEEVETDFQFFFFTDQYKRRKQQNQAFPKHQDIMARILYIYGLLNPAIQYVQGMSDLLAPLYLIIQNEADTFFCFTKLMAQVKDAYISDLDFTSSGIRGLLLQFEQVFKIKEPQLYKHLQKLGIHPYMFGYRWIITCMTREFHIEQIFSLWDFMLQSRNIHDFVIKLAISIIRYLKPQLMEADFKLAFDILIYSEKDVDQILNFM